MATEIPDNDAPIARADLERLAGRALPELPAVMHGISTDTRRLRAGMVYLALRGESFDGHAFVAKALELGAACCVVSEGPGVRVPDTLVAWGELARLHLSALRAAGTVVLAITGSAGKTTTKEMTAALLAERGVTVATRGNLNNRVGLPATIFATRAAQFLVLEAGMSLIGEMAQLAHIANPDIAVIMNVGVAHSEGVGGREGVAREKGALYTGIREGGTAVVAADDSYVVAAAACVPNQVSFGVGPADYRLLARSVGVAGAELLLSRHGVELAVHSPLQGAAQAMDLVGALAMADRAAALAGLPPLEVAEIERALGRVELLGRGSRHALATGGGFVLDDTYNASPDSMRHAVQLLCEVAGGRRRVLVLGEMRELGALAESAHRELGAVLVSARPDLVIGCGGLVEIALDVAEAADVSVLRAPDAAAAAILARAAVLPEDAVLVKASRGVRAERVVHALRERLGDP